jgi:hypothetical protein
MSNPFQLELLERRALLTGVTLVTHGFGGGTGGWVTAMGELIAQQTGPLAQQPRLKMTVTDGGAQGSPISVMTSLLAGSPAPASWGSREIIVLLDWSSLAGSFSNFYTRTSGAVGAAVATALLAPTGIAGFNVPLAQLPMHMLGHSRGASVISEIAKGLGQRGAWVDQLTYLDPHPVDGYNEPLGFNFNDAPMRVYDNVLFADDYWRTEGGSSFDFTGEAVNGAANLQLSEAVLSNGGDSIDHTDVHLWYHGTIGPVGGPFQNSDQPDGTPAVGPGWYSAPHPSRESTAWRYSRLAVGARPAAGLKSAGAAREAVALTVGGANVWDNIGINGLAADTTVVQGTDLNVPLQWGDVNDDATITVGFDRDDDPYNGVFSSVSFATSTVAGESAFAPVPTTGVAGGFRVFAKISNGTTSRFHYAPGRAIVTAANSSKTWIGPANGAWGLASNWSGNAIPTMTDTVAIYDSDVTLAQSITRLAGLSLNPTARLEIGTGALVIDYPSGGPSPFASISSLLASGRTISGTWNGTTGITSAFAGTQGGLTTLGVAEASAILSLDGTATATWRNQTVDATSVLIRYTYDGDANLDGFISGDDYSSIDFAIAVPGANGYFNGDFNYDAVISGDDYSVIDFNIAAQNAPL